MSTKDMVLSALEERRGGFISGEELAEKLNITRSSVWKAIKALESDGCEIEAVNNRGYSIAADADILSAAGIEALLTQPERIKIDLRREVTSTNTVLKELAAAGAGECTVLIARRQSAGRGRVGRSFFAPEGTGLYMSILLRPNFGLETSPMLMTVAAAATALAIERVSGKSPDIKWVNDVWLNGKKLCGILTEASVSVENGSLEYAVVGIGINVFTPKGGFPDGLGEVATAVFSEGERRANARNELAAELLNTFFDFYDNMAYGTYFDEYKKRSFLIGREINVIRPDSVIPAIALDIDRECRLLVRYEDGREEYLNSGEVSTRPV